MFIHVGVRNPSKTAARVEQVTLNVNDWTVDWRVEALLTPDDVYWHHLPQIELATEAIVNPHNHVSLVDVSGRIEYVDVFGKTRYRRFARHFICAPGHNVNISIPTGSTPDGIGRNDEENWQAD